MIYSTNNYQNLTLESWFSNLEQMPLKKTKAFFGKHTARKKTAFLHTLFVENERETRKLNPFTTNGQFSVFRPK